MKILNLFAGIGGNRTLWEDEHKITAVEYILKIAMIYHKRFPKDSIIVEDAYEFLEKNYKEFDFIWASPPCYTHTRLVAFPSFKPKLPDMRLYSIIIFLQRFFKGYWVVENVIPHYTPLIKPTTIIDRHYIWSNYHLETKKWKKPKGNFKDLKLPIMCDWLGVEEELINSLPASSKRNHDNKRSVLRNCVLPEAGKYILDSLKIPNLEKFIK